MGNIYFLNCSLDDEGDKKLKEIQINTIKKSKIDIIELIHLSKKKMKCEKSIFDTLQLQINEFQSTGRKVQFSVTIDSVSEIPVSQLISVLGDNINVIRVNIHKTNVLEGWKYCEELRKNGFEVCVMPERIAQYSDEEFIDLLKLFEGLMPYAIYIVESVGLLSINLLKHYLDLADSNLNVQIAIGIHIANYLEGYHFVRECINYNIVRDVIIDGNLNDKCNKLNLQRIIDYWETSKNIKESANQVILNYNKLVVEVYENSKWEIDIVNYIAAKYNCNPIYALYYKNNKGVFLKELEKVIQEISQDEKILFSEETANKYLSIVRKKYWKNRLAVIIMTANRASSIEYYLKIVSDMFQIREIDLIIFDSSDDIKTKNIVEGYIKKGYTCIHYDYYDGEFDGISIDDKVISAYKKYANKYEYLWVSRDGIIINLEFVINDLDVFLCQGMDLIVVDSDFRDIKQTGVRYYNDVGEFFKERCMQMTVLGGTIVKSTLIKEVIKNVPLDRIKNYGMWQPIAFFEYISDKNVKVSNYVGPLFIPNVQAVASSFWTKRLLWQWGERWYTMIAALPDIYNPYKELVMKDEMVDFHPFSVRFIIKCRENGGLTLSTINRYKEYIPYVCDTPIWKFYVVSIIPVWLIKLAVRKSNSLFYNVARKIYRKCLKVPVYE